MFEKIDCIRLQVPDLEAALEFYRDYFVLIGPSIHECAPLLNLE